MAGRGPAPKDPRKRARTNSDQVPLRVIAAEPVTQPELPEVMPDGNPWPGRTMAWWKMWAESPLSAEFTSTDWSELMDTAVLHGAYWSGETRHAGELRLRVAKFGATPEDRARLRITFAAADDAEEKRPARTSSRARRGGLTALPDAK